MASSTIKKTPSIYPNYANGAVATLNTVSAQYQCVKNGFLIGQMQKATNGQAIVFVSGQGLVATSDAHTIVDVFIPVRAGEIISTRAYGIYALNVYEE